MRKHALRIAALALAAGSFAFMGCDDDDTRAPDVVPDGPAERAGERIDRAGERIGEEMRDAGEQMRDTFRDDDRIDQSAPTTRRAEPLPQ